MDSYFEKAAGMLEDLDNAMDESPYAPNQGEQLAYVQACALLSIAESLERLASCVASTEFTTSWFQVDNRDKTY